MSVPGRTSKYQFEKRRAAATVTLSTGGSIEGHFFIAGGITRHEGPERIGELLNAEGGFFPFEVRDVEPRTLLVNRSHVVMVSLAEDETATDPAHTVASKRAVQMLLSTGERLIATIRVIRPEGHDRVSDWTRQPEVFRYVEALGRTLIVNMFHIIDVSEVPES